MTDSVTTVLRGELHWAKVVGPARPHTGEKRYDKGPYWSVDFTPDAKSLATMKKLGIDSKMRDPAKNKKDDRNEDYLPLRVLENRSNGEKNSPPNIYDIRGKEWDSGKLLGNGTVADIKVKVVDYGRGIEKGVYLQAIRVLKHVPYEGGGFEALSEDDEYFASDNNDSVSDEWDDDDIPS